MSVPEKITEVLKKESRLTITEITERLNETKRERLVRESVYRLLKRKIIVKDGKKGKAYLYSLKENAIEPKILLKQLYNIMDNKMEFKEIPMHKESKIINKIEELIKE